MRPGGLEKAPLFLLPCGRRHARAAELAASAARVLAGPTPVAGKAISVATLWLTALGRGALCTAETTARGAAAGCLPLSHTDTHRAESADHTVNRCVCLRGARDRLEPVPATSIVVDPARAEIPGSMSQGDPRVSACGAVCGVECGCYCAVCRREVRARRRLRRQGWWRRRRRRQRLARARVAGAASASARASVGGSGSSHSGGGVDDGGEGGDVGVVVVVGGGGAGGG
jgi:hypothetical protein